MLRYPAVISGVTEGHAHIQGATYMGAGTSFALYSEHAERVELCLFDDESQEQARIALPGRTHNVWHGFVPGVGPGQRYGYRVHGPFAPERGHYFNAHKLLVDPYARALDRVSRWHPALQNERDPSAGTGFAVDSAVVAPRSVVVDEHFDWEGDTAPRVPWRDTVIYECHVKGLTQLHPDVPPELRGTYLGLATPPVIEHLVSLGVTAVELLPVQQSFSERYLVQRGLTNYWGYNTVGFFAPDTRYAVPATTSNVVTEWKTMVKALHRAGIEVILDVVYNHTGEADPTGPLVSLRGIDNAVYYRLDPSDRSRYIDTTGCGNSLNFDHPQTQQLVMDSLRYWVRDMHVDGFRFDLAPSLARGAHGLDLEGRFFAQIKQDPILAQTKLIVEPWDVGPDGLRTGGFRAGYAEWNDRYRDSLRRFVRGDGGQIGELATRLAGSSDLFSSAGRGPLASINYITSHDGRSLRDLVSYEGKYNADNGWDNRDGSDNEHASNWGVEGPSDRVEIEALRQRVMRTYLLSLACSQGVPMLRQGDELGQSQRGNNNAYPQDNALSWMDWSRGPDQRALYEFTRSALALRRALPELRRDDHLRGELPGRARDVTWLREDGEPMQASDFSAGERRALGMWLGAAHSDGASVLVLWNGGRQPISFRLPEGLFELHLDSAQSIAPGTQLEAAVPLQPHSCALLVALPLAAPLVRPPSELDRELLARLGARYGVADGYVGYTGQAHDTSSATRITLLAAMGVDATTSAACRAELARLDAEAAAPGIAAVRVLPDGADALRRVELTPPQPPPHVLRYQLELVLESGERFTQEGWVRDPGRRVSVPLPSSIALPLGYHTLSVRVADGLAGGEQVYEQTLIVTPRSCPKVTSLIGARGGAGLWTHVYTLHSERGLGLGDLSDLRALVGFAAREQLDFVGINPLHAVDNYAGVVSPYYPLSRVYGNPLYIDLEAVPELTHCESARTLFASATVQNELARLRERPRRDYAAAWRLKLAVLRALHACFVSRELSQGTARARAYTAYLAEHGPALRNFATFCAIAEALGDDPPIYDFHHFPSELRDPSSSAVKRLQTELAEPIALHMYLQFELSRQIEAAQIDARAQGLRIGLYGDLAVGNASGGADVWAHRDLFARGVALGAPPDPYSAVGQSWGLVPLLPRRLADERFEYFRRLARTAVRSAGMLRVDHVMGLTRQFWVPDGATAREGAYVRFPFEEMCGILALEAHRTRTLVIGEDLGVVPPGLRERMAELELMRSQVVCFERDDAGTFKTPSAYARTALATVNTHDMPPLLGYFDSRDVDLLRTLGILPDAQSEARLRNERAAAKAALLDLLEREQLWPPPNGERSDAAWTVAVHELLARTRSVLVAASLEDLCLEVEPLNVPGVASPEHPSWTKRMHASIEALSQDPTVLRCLAALRAGRAGG
ncbi:MAG: glycogen debranching protein GlgX [Polyangiales bacterium]